MAKSLIVETYASSCYFRTSVEDGERKALVQITERCNLHCAHCFVSSTEEGLDISFEDYATRVLPRLMEAGVTRITLTGGEPFAHPNLLAICKLTVDWGLSVGVCSNATLATDEQIEFLAKLGVHINVSFDGFRAQSHGKFRGNTKSFDTTVETTRKFAEAGLLQGLLSTPNSLTREGEFADLCRFAMEIGAKYVLMNPLSSFGRGVKSRGKLAAPEEVMSQIRKETEGFDVDTVHIRFPNDDAKPLAGCDAGKLIYVFASGEVAVCPYLVFAARTPASEHKDDEFLAGNILQGDVAEQLNGFDMSKLAMGQNDTCRSCSLEACQKGCPAAVIANGGRVGELDELCPRPLLQIGRRV